MEGKHRELSTMSKGECLVRIFRNSKRKVWVVKGIFDCDPLCGVKDEQSPDEVEEMSIDRICGRDNFL